MYIKKLESPNQEAVSLWELNMVGEKFSDYDGADMFLLYDTSSEPDKIVGGFAVYRDNSDGIDGIFCSGWAARHKKVPVAQVIKQIAKNYGDLYFKTDKRPAKILLEKIGKKVKITDRFVYYIVKDD